MSAESSLSQLVTRGYRIDGGVVHVGSNDGEEVQWYLDLGMRPVLCFEPHSKAFERGVARYNEAIAERHVRFFACGLGDHESWLTFVVPVDGDDEKTSHYKAIPTAGHEWTEVAGGKAFTAPVYRFDELARIWKIDPTLYNTLVVDVQGMEFEVLHGFGDLLFGFDFLCVELSAKPVYDGEAPAEDVINYVGNLGFKQVTEVKEHDDVLFVKSWLA